MKLAGHQGRRRWVIGSTLVVGAGLLWATLAAVPGSGPFFGLGLASAATWIVGAIAAGPIPWWGNDRHFPRSVQVGVAVGLGVILFGAFVVVKLAGAQLPLLSGSVARVLGRADAGPRAMELAVALVNGVGEEMFFRGALQSAFGGRRAVLWTTVIYTVVTIATLEPALVAAALVMGLVFSAQRQVTGGVWAPVLTHLTWSTLVLFLLPR